MIVRAYAKVNLGLAVLRKRADGFHDIETIFALIDLYDVIRLEPKQSNITLGVKNANLPTNENNLVYKAARLYLDEAKIKAGVNIVLEKYIPISAGLGGGSSDAAATLKAMKILYPSEANLIKIANELGSDVAFFLSGFNTAYGSSRGEVLIDLNLKKRSILLLNPGVEVSAKDAYQNLTRFDHKLDVQLILRQLNEGEVPEYLNTLESSVLEFEPRVKAAIDVLKSFSNLFGVLMSGSGASCFAFAGSDVELERARAQIAKQQPDFWLQICQTM